MQVRVNFARQASFVEHKTPRRTAPRAAEESSKRTEAGVNAKCVPRAGFRLAQVRKTAMTAALTHSAQIQTDPGRAIHALAEDPLYSREARRALCVR